jgi:predicted metal-dependent peptidase
VTAEDAARSAADREPLDRTRLLAARLLAATAQPYLASALFSMSVVESREVPTMGVDRWWRCYANPAFVARTPVPELAAVWLHEAGHLVRDHHARAERLHPDLAGSPERVNAAEDCEINDDLGPDRAELARAGIALPAGALVPGTWGMPPGLPFEEYLRRLPAARPGGGGAECGPGAHGRARGWELPEPRGSGAWVGGTEAEALRRLVAAEIRAHARGRDDVPGGWRRWAEAHGVPQVDWRRVLAGRIRAAVAWTAGAVDYTYRRPSRRGAALPGVVLPSLRRPAPAVAVVVDTSASMEREDLDAALTEIDGILRGIGVGRDRTTVLACDAGAGTAQRVSSAREVVLTGGGGTDMRVGIDAALRGPAPPDVVVVLTDGWTPWPDRPPRARVIAGLIGRDAPAPPAWIDRVTITPGA